MTYAIRLLHRYLALSTVLFSCFSASLPRSSFPRDFIGIEGVRYLGYEAEWRENEDSVKRAMLILDPTQTAAEDGFVIGWHVYTTRGRRSQKVFLQIWSPMKPLENRYSLVGETMIVALWVGHNYFALYPRDRIRVHRGDVLGVYFPKYNPIPWSPVDCHDGNQHLYKYNPYSVTSSLASSGPADGGGQRSSVEVTFIKGRSDWNPCRKYSLNATIMSEYEMAQYDTWLPMYSPEMAQYDTWLPMYSPEMAQYDVDYQETTDGRYERRPYGQNLSMKRASSGSSSLHDASSSRFSGLPTLFAAAIPELSVALAQLQSTATLATLAIAARAISVYELTLS